MNTPKLYQLLIRADKAICANCTNLLENSEPAPLSSSHYEEDKIWKSALIYDHEPNLGLLKTHICTSLEINPSEVSLQSETIEDKDWVSHVQSGLKPVHAGLFFIYGSHDKDKTQGKEFTIEIDAAQAFGTAHHGTTKGCLIAIDEHAKQTTPNTILDLGTGTGILAIGAALLWPKAKIIASDIDPIAIGVAQYNTQLNNQTESIHTLCADGFDDETLQANAPYDLVIANILAKPLIAMASDLSQIIAQGGHAILSGILSTQANALITSYEATGLIHRSTKHYDEWVTIHFEKP